MLDRKTKNIDASVEILEDRKKTCKIYFFIFFIIGWAAVWFSAIFAPYKYDEIGMCVGIASLIFATWMLIILNHYNILIFLKREENKKL